MENNLSVFTQALKGTLGDDTINVVSARKLSGGAIQENWWLVIERKGLEENVILRSDAPAGVSASHSRNAEYILLQAAHKAGVTAPQPLGIASANNPLGRPFFVMQAVNGEALCTKVVRSPAYENVRKTLAQDLGRELAKIHAIELDDNLRTILDDQVEDPARERITTYYQMLDALDRPSPVIELALRWLSNNAPTPSEITFVHRDFRTGNYMIDESGVTAILDWEFCGLSDPHEDLAWFLSGDWRFGRDDLEAGGVGTRADFLSAYQQQSNRLIDEAKIEYWSVMAAVRWAIIALQQGDRLTKGGEERTELALVARRVFPTEMRLLNLLKPLLEKSA